MALHCWTWLHGYLRLLLDIGGLEDARRQCELETLTLPNFGFGMAGCRSSDHRNEFVDPGQRNVQLVCIEGGAVGYRGLVFVYSEQGTTVPAIGSILLDRRSSVASLVELSRWQRPGKLTLLDDAGAAWRKYDTIPATVALAGPEYLALPAS
eukprot:SAG31_NODE_17930_length_653_cov_0.740072_1_plen_151_part_01